MSHIGTQDGGDTCTPMADSYDVWQKPSQYYKVNYPSIKVNKVSHSKLEAFYQHWHTEQGWAPNGADAEGFVNLQGDTLHGLVSVTLIIVCLLTSFIWRRV